MSRSGYTDECEHLELYRGSVSRATKGSRGQYLLKKLLAALDAMPEKRLIVGEIQDGHGDVCVFGALDPTVKGDNAEDLAKHFGIALALASEIVYENDEGYRFHFENKSETPEERWTRMRAWVDAQILKDDATS